MLLNYQVPKREISLLSKGLRCVSTSNRIDKAKLKHILEAFERKPRLMLHFQNYERIFDCNYKFRLISTSNPKNKDVIIETYR